MAGTIAAIKVARMVTVFGSLHQGRKVEAACRFEANTASIDLTRSSKLKVCSMAATRVLRSALASVIVTGGSVLFSPKETSHQFVPAQLDTFVVERWMI